MSLRRSFAVAVRLYGCDARRNLGPLATPIRCLWGIAALAFGLVPAAQPPEGAVRVKGFDFPDALHYLVEHQVWVRLEGEGVACVGITALGIHLAGGEIYMARPKSVGSVVEQGGSIAVVELAKAIVSVKSPVSGTVLEVNGLLAAQPELVHREPYGAGWLARLRLSGWAADEARLAHGEAAVRPAMEHHAWLHQVEG
jgi:glycine cleavage system H protein